MTEHDIQSAIIYLIRLRGGVVTRINSGSMLAKSQTDRVYRVQLADKGTSDIIALYKGVYLAIEVKHGKNTATPEQIEFLESVARAGGVGLIAYDVIFVDTVLNAWDMCYEYFTLKRVEMIEAYIPENKPNRLFIGVE